MLGRECHAIKRIECRWLGAKNSRTIGPITDLRKARFLISKSEGGGVCRWLLLAWMPQVFSSAQTELDVLEVLTRPRRLGNSGSFEEVV